MLVVEVMDSSMKSSDRMLISMELKFAGLIYKDERASSELQSLMRSMEYGPSSKHKSSGEDLSKTTTESQRTFPKGLSVIGVVNIEKKDEMEILPKDGEPLSPISVLETQIMENPLEPPVWDSYDGLDDEF